MNQLLRQNQDQTTDLAQWREAPRLIRRISVGMGRIPIRGQVNIWGFPR